MTDRHEEAIEKAAEAVLDEVHGSCTEAERCEFCNDEASRTARAAVTAYLDHMHPVVDSAEADRLPDGSVIQLRDGTVRLATGWGSGWASSSTGDDHPLDLNGDFPARVLHWGDR